MSPVSDAHWPHVAQGYRVGQNRWSPFPWLQKLLLGKTDPGDMRSPFLAWLGKAVRQKKEKEKKKSPALLYKQAVPRDVGMSGLLSEVSKREEKQNTAEARTSCFRHHY